MNKVTTEIINLVKFAQERDLDIIEIQATIGDILEVTEDLGIDGALKKIKFPFRIGDKIALICK